MASSGNQVPHLRVTVRECILERSNCPLSLATLHVILKYHGIEIQGGAISWEESTTRVEATFNFDAYFHQRHLDPGGMQVTIQNGSGHFLGSCWVDLRRLFPYQRQNFVPILRRLNGEIVGVVDIDFELGYRAFPNIEVILPQGHEACHAEVLPIAQETDPGANPSTATSAPETAPPSSRAPFSSPTAPPPAEDPGQSATAQSSVSITSGSLTAPISAAESVARLSSLIAADVVQSSTAQLSSLTAAPLAEDDLLQSTAAQPSISYTRGSSTAPASAED